jgi:thiosulfate dehydrogenase
MFPRPPNLFERHRDHVGVSDDEPGETWWKVANGIRLSGMPAYAKLLDEKGMWQVTLLLANADKLPPSVLELLKPPPAPTIK